MDKTLIITNPIDLTQDDIMSLGQDVTTKISNFSMKMMDRFDDYTYLDASRVLGKLNVIMKSFDLNDFEEKETGILGKLFNNVSRQIEKMMSKYNSFNDNIEFVFKEIKTYELDIKDSNQMLLEMFDENKIYHSELENLIIEATNIKNQMKIALETTEDQIHQIDLSDKIQLLDHRIYDLELAKAVSLQTAPQIKLMQKTNTDLIRKISSSFVITLPIFRNGIVQAMTLKRQLVQTEALKGLDAATNELLQKNAENIIRNTKQAVELNGQPIIQIETLKKSYQTILTGIIEVQELEEVNRTARIEGLKSLKSLKEHLISGKPLFTEAEGK